MALKVKKADMWDNDMRIQDIPDSREQDKIRGKYAKAKKLLGWEW